MKMKIIKVKVKKRDDDEIMAIDHLHDVGYAGYVLKCNACLLMNGPVTFQNPT